MFGTSTTIVNTADALIRPKRIPGVSLEIHENIQTIHENENKFTNRDVLKAKAMRRFQHIAGHPSNATILAMITK